MEQRIEELEKEKASQLDITNAISNVTTTHHSDMASINRSLDYIIYNLDSKINQTLTQKIHLISKNIRFESSSTKSYTGLSVTIPANSYFCLTGRVDWVQSIPRLVSINWS